MDLYLYMTEDYQEIENDKLKEEVFFQVKNFYITNDLNSIDKDIDYFKFKEEDIKSVKNIDLMYDIFEYNYNLSEEICRLIRDTKENKDKLKFFEENLKEKVIFDNSIDDLNDFISIITFKDEIVAYNLDKRCKRDFSDYIYFKDEDPDNAYLVLEELENSYILGLLEYPEIEMDFSTPKDVVIEIQENTEEYKKAKQIILNKLK